jgi:hypothetical protein
MGRVMDFRAAVQEVQVVYPQDYRRILARGSNDQKPGQLGPLGRGRGL